MKLHGVRLFLQGSLNSGMRSHSFPFAYTTLDFRNFGAFLSNFLELKNNYFSINQVKNISAIKIVLCNFTDFMEKLLTLSGTTVMVIKEQIFL